jgi:hypothetical protein
MPGHDLFDRGRVEQVHRDRFRALFPQLRSLGASARDSGHLASGIIGISLRPTTPVAPATKIFTSAFAGFSFDPAWSLLFSGAGALAAE